MARNPPVAAIDMMTGMAVVARIYEALYVRARTGNGSYISISLEETAALMMTHPWLMYLHGGDVYQASGSKHPNIAPYEVFQTKDKPILVGAVDDLQFRRFSDVIGHPEWVDDPTWSTNGNRVRHREALHQAIQSELLTQNANDWRELFSNAKLPVGIVESVDSAASGWKNSQAPKLTAEHPVFGSMTWPVSPWRQDGGRVLAPPTLGNSTHDILVAWLGPHNS